MSFIQNQKPIAGAVLVIAAIVFSFPENAEDAIESTQDKIARAMLAAPESIAAAATIMDVDGTLLREGNNGWTCFPGVGLIPGDKHPMCNDAVWMKWMATAAAGKPFETDVIGYSTMLAGDALVNNDDPTATDPHAGGPYVMWGGTPMEHVMVPIGGEIPE